ncbi:MAG: hypothetical protein DMF77_17310 [Acidobacteria bacterium]|nr:MAG: hypothetical protein DMF77_17310 [Acidobacteriota bacterium]
MAMRTASRSSFASISRQSSYFRGAGQPIFTRLSAASSRRWGLMSHTARRSTKSLLHWPRRTLPCEPGPMKPALTGPPRMGPRRAAATPKARRGGAPAIALRKLRRPIATSSGVSTMKSFLLRSTGRE